ncbi:shikimate kinase [Spiribacter vilamensis]|uniref:Shikimate kinase n=1 Tax=Spiribacter vilamensis TaxID=531306 RepID=A0A4Q8D176_9GAMM|nr:shikimate kinase [Spiribacter vilamensis]RZU98997.1 shikimate kinase [Spiribacter vilamensis]TVO61999.1 shikimate kinase [Spiribacter vilamensis]
MTAARHNLVLIGMPGAGKSTLGRHLAERLGLGFTDTDTLIESAAGTTLQTIVDERGHRALRALEAEHLVELRRRGHVIATGGSAVYSPEAMAALRSDGIIIHLHADLAIIQARVTDVDTRGLARAAGQSLEDLYTEREALYRDYAEVSVDVGPLSTAAGAEAVIAALHAPRAPRLASPLA